MLCVQPHLIFVATLAVSAALLQAQPTAVELTPHRYELALTLDEFSVFHGAAASGVERYGGWAEFDVRIDATDGGAPVWTVTIDNPQMLEVWQQWMAQSTAELVGMVDFERLDRGSVGALAVTQSVNTKVEQALASPIWDSSTVAGTLLVERAGEGPTRVVLVPLSGDLADATGPAAEFEPQPLVLTGAVAEELAGSELVAQEVLAAGPIKAYGYMELEGVTERLDDTVEIFVMSQCPYGVGAMTAAIERVRELERLGEPAPELDIRYIFYEAPQEARQDASQAGPGQAATRYTSMRGEAEVLENLVQMAIRDEHYQHYFDYLMLRSTTPAADWRQLARAAGIDPLAIDAIEQMVEFERHEMIAREHAYVARQRGVTDGSPTWSYESRLVAGPQDIPGFESLNVQSGGCAGGH
ncbi:MAG: hypothetical protein ACIAS6_01540 [Phycisphaerales bacterium JB060]